MQDPVSLVVVGLTALVGLLVGLKALLKPADPSKQYITRGEVQLALDQVYAAIKSLKAEFDTKIDALSKSADRIADEIVTRTDKISDYNSRVAHEQAGHLHDLGLKVATLLAFHQAEKKTSAPTPP